MLTRMEILSHRLRSVQFLHAVHTWVYVLNVMEQTLQQVRLSRLVRQSVSSRAQSIGEPGTQLTMRTFHTGGVAGGDITQGLPRVEEIFEARKPKGLAIITEFGGVATIKDTKKNVKLSLQTTRQVRQRHTLSHTDHVSRSLMVQRLRLVMNLQRVL